MYLGDISEPGNRQLEAWRQTLASWARLSSDLCGRDGVEFWCVDFYRGTTEVS